MEHASDPMAEPSTSSECVRDELHVEAAPSAGLVPTTKSTGLPPTP